MGQELALEIATSPINRPMGLMHNEILQDLLEGLAGRRVEWVLRTQGRRSLPEWWGTRNSMGCCWSLGALESTWADTPVTCLQDCTCWSILQSLSITTTRQACRTAHHVKTLPPHKVLEPTKQHRFWCRSQYRWKFTYEHHFPADSAFTQALSYLRKIPRQIHFFKVQNPILKFYIYDSWYP